MKVFIPQPIAEDGKTFLRERGYEIALGSGVAEDDLIRVGEDCDAILGRTAKITARVLEACPRLKVVARHGVGFENVDIEKAAELGIWVTNTPEALTATVAEHAIGLLLAVSKHIAWGDRETRRGNFVARDRMQGLDIAGKTLGLVGIGRIGSAVAKRATAGLEMKVLAYDPFVKAAPEGIKLVGSLDELLEAADFVSLHLPSTPKTRGIISKDAFERMKRGAYLINTARGEIVDEDALVEALKTRTIAGAALDVLRDEPPAADNPLFALDNVVLTPHNAALTSECLVRLATHAARSIDEVLTGKNPSWPVNRPARPRA